MLPLTITHDSRIHSTTHLTAYADQLAAEARDARCCDALAPCDRCTTRAMIVRVARRITLQSRKA